MGTSQDDQLEPALTKSQVLEAEYEALRGKLPRGYSVPATGDRAACEKQQLDAYYKALHREKEPLTALCLSGGGIRSATFALGVLQGLARRGLLKDFDFLSTVSGGGYIGSWLTAWIHRSRDSCRGVYKGLGDKEKQQTDGNVRPKDESECEALEAEEVRHLRDYSNYLTPRLGLLRPDSATLFATYIRNLLLNWIVLAPLIIGLLLLPRLYVAVLYAVQLKAWGWWGTVCAYGSLTLGQLLLATAIIVPVLWLPGSRKPGEESAEGNRSPGPKKVGLSTGRVVAFVVLPVFLCGLVLSLTVAWGGRELVSQAWWSWSWFLVFVCSPVFAAWVRDKSDRMALDLRSVVAMVLSGAIIGPVSVALMGSEPMRDFEQFPRAFACFRVGGTFLLYLMLVTLYVGFTSGRPGGDDDREWWARLMGWILLMAAVWIVAVGIGLCGPLIVTIAREAELPLIPSSLLIALVAAFSGRSGSTSASDSESIGWWQRILHGAPEVLGIVALLLFFLLASYGVDALMHAILAGHQMHFGEWYVIPPDPQHSIPRGFAETFRLLGLEVLALSLLAASGLLMNFNRFSLHAMYRDRLIRAFLGASNKNRNIDRFTGFDPEDNIPLHHLRRGRWFIKEDLGSAANVKALAEMLSNDNHHISHFLRDLAGWEWQALSGCVEPPPPTKLVREIAAGAPLKTQSTTTKMLASEQSRTDLAGVLLRFLNAVVVQQELTEYQTAPTPEQESAEIRRARRALQADRSPVMLNRLILEKMLVAEVPANSGNAVELLKTRTSKQTPRPLHLINMALNLVDTNELAWQQRKAVSFTASPLHCGFYRGYRRSDEYGGPMSLGTAMTISGAAASPNMGYHSSPAVTFLMTLFNVRLGWWLGNPANPRRGWLQRLVEIFVPRDVYRRTDPRNSVLPLINEAMGLTNDRYSYVYLSDGGHFDNLGLYEMVVRRCRYIVVCDASCDPQYKFQDLANSIRRIQNDLNIGITMREVRLFPPHETDKKSRYCAVGDIQYDDVDGTKNKNGILIYLKPTLHEFLPVDVFNHRKVDSRFPHEPTSNQWFSEAQFESYRKLGLSIVDYLTRRMKSGERILGPRDEARGSLEKIAENLAANAKESTMGDFSLAAVHEAYSKPEDDKPKRKAGRKTAKQKRRRKQT